MIKYMIPERLEDFLKAQVILDIIMKEEEDAWLRVTSQYEIENGRAYVIDNGAGDTLKIYFTEKGVFLKGFDHENELNQFGADEWEQNEIEDNDGGKEFLLGYIHETAEAWEDWAKYYYSTTFAMDVIRKIYNKESINKGDILAINPQRDADKALKEIAKLL